MLQCTHTVLRHDSLVNVCVCSCFGTFMLLFVLWLSVMHLSDKCMSALVVITGFGVVASVVEINTRMVVCFIFPRHDTNTFYKLYSSVPFSPSHY